MAAVASIAPCAPTALAGPSVASRNVVGQNAQLGMPLRARQCQTLRVSRRPFGVKTVSTEVSGEEKIGHGSRIEISSSSLFVGTGVHASSSSVFFSIDRSSLVKKGQVIGSQRRPARLQSLVVRGLFGLGVPELAVIAGVAALLFGPKKLPEIGKSLGKTVKSFQQAAKEFETAVKTGAESAESAEPETRVTPTSDPPPPTPTTTSTPSEKESV